MLLRILGFASAVSIVIMLLIIGDDSPLHGYRSSTRARWVMIFTVVGTSCLFFTPGFGGTSIQSIPNPVLRALGWVLCFFAVLSFFLL